MELIISILCDSNADIISYENNTKLYELINENNTKLYELIVTFLLCKRSKLTSCNIPYEGVPLQFLLLPPPLIQLAEWSSSQCPCK